jgi:hypothetical protein
VHTYALRKTAPINLPYAAEYSHGKPTGQEDRRFILRLREAPELWIKRPWTLEEETKMRVLLLITLVFALSSTMVATASQARECGITCFGVTCDGSTYVVAWSYINTCDDPPTFTVEYQCCPNGGWVVAGDDISGTEYKFVPAVGCLSGEYRIRLTINCQGCSCTGPMCVVQTQDCMSCP